MARLTIPEVNALAAEAMGWEPRHSIEDDSRDRWVRLTGKTQPQWEYTASINDWSPYTDIADAMVLVEKLEESGWLWSLGRAMSGKWCRVYEDKLPVARKEFYAENAALPAAITLAFLRANGVEVGEIDDV